MKNLPIRILLCLLFAAAWLPVAGHNSTGNVLPWLEGCWESTDKRSMEVWVSDDTGDLDGFGVAMHEGSVVFYEILGIRLDEDGSLVYRAVPSGQSPTSFQATEWTDSSVAFTNPAHDYPQRIEYRREGDKLFAQISMLNGEKPNAFDKIACQ